MPGNLFKQLMTQFVFGMREVAGIFEKMPFWGHSHLPDRSASTSPLPSTGKHIKARDADMGLGFLPPSGLGQRQKLPSLPCLR